MARSKKNVEQAVVADVQAAMSVQGEASSFVVEGLAALTKEEKIAKIKALEAAKRARGSAEKEQAKRIAKLRALASRNPSLLPDTLRQAREGELINGLPAKGWVVSISCEMCGELREINTQDAFQVRFCTEHKGEAQKAASKARRMAKKDAAFAALSDEDLAAELAKLEAELAA
jgi:hypothetical protein